MKPLYDRKEIGMTLKFYSQHPEFKFPERTGGIIPSNDEGTIDKYIDWLETETSYSIPYKKFIRVMTVFREKIKIAGDSEALKIVNKLIGDKRLFKKLRFIDDGSYRNNKIFMRFFKTINPDVFLIDYCREDGEKTDLWNMIRKYPAIFCQLPIDKKTFEIVIPLFYIDLFSIDDCIDDDEFYFDGSDDLDFDRNIDLNFDEEDIEGA